MNARKSRVYKVGDSFAVVLPRDWVRGNRIEKGTLVEIEYDGEVTVKAPVAQDHEDNDTDEATG